MKERDKMRDRWKKRVFNKERLNVRNITRRRQDDRKSVIYLIRPDRLYS